MSSNIIKKFINDIKLSLVCGILFILSVGFLIICFNGADTSPKPWVAKTAVSVIFGGACLGCCICMSFCEIITIFEDRIICRSFRYNQSIYYEDIEAITLIHKKGYGVGGVELVWEINDCIGNKIYVLKSKRRMAYIDFIKEKACRL